MFCPTTIGSPSPIRGASSGIFCHDHPPLGTHASLVAAPSAPAQTPIANLDTPGRGTPSCSGQSICDTHTAPAAASSAPVHRKGVRQWVTDGGTLCHDHLCPDPHTRPVVAPSCSGHPRSEPPMTSAAASSALAPCRLVAQSITGESTPREMDEPSPKNDSPSGNPPALAHDGFDLHSEIGQGTFSLGVHCPLDPHGRSAARGTLVQPEKPRHPQRPRCTRPRPTGKLNPMWNRRGHLLALVHQSPELHCRDGQGEHLLARSQSVTQRSCGQDPSATAHSPSGPPLEHRRGDLTANGLPMPNRHRAVPPRGRPVSGRHPWIGR